MKRKKIKKTLKDRSLRELRVYCSKNGIPWLGLKKTEVISNIKSFKRGLNIYPFPDKKSTYLENRGKNKQITQRMKYFCLCYALSRKLRTRKEWAEQFNVSESTINTWLSRQDIKNLMEEYSISHEKSIQGVFVANEVEVVEELIKMCRSRKLTETKRKSIMNFLGLMGRVDVNSGKVQINNSQLQQQNFSSEISVSDMKEEDIDKELSEIEELIE